MANAKETSVSGKNQKPVQVFRYRGISASVFQNHAEQNGSKRAFYKVALQRTYRDGDEYRTTTSFSRDDLPIVSLLAGQSWQFVLDAETRRGGDDSEDQE